MARTWEEGECIWRVPSRNAAAVQWFLALRSADDVLVLGSADFAVSQRLW